MPFETIEELYIYLTTEKLPDLLSCVKLSTMYKKMIPGGRIDNFKPDDPARPWMGGSSNCMLSFRNDSIKDIFEEELDIPDWNISIAPSGIRFNTKRSIISGSESVIIEGYSRILSRNDITIEKVDIILLSKIISKNIQKGVINNHFQEIFNENIV